MDKKTNFAPDTILVVERNNLRCECKVISQNTKNEMLFLCNTPFGMHYIHRNNIQGESNRTTWTK